MPCISRVVPHQINRSQWGAFTIVADFQVNDIPNTNIDDTKKALVLLFKLLLVEYLDGQYTVLGHFPRFVTLVITERSLHGIMDLSIQIKDFVPIRIECLLDD